MLRFPQLGFGFEALALGFLQRCELLFGGFDTKFYGGIEGLCCLVKQLARSLRIGGAPPLLQRRRSEERREGKSVSVRVDLGGRRIIKKKNKYRAIRTIQRKKQ